MTRSPNNSLFPVCFLGGLVILHFLFYHYILHYVHTSLMHVSKLIREWNIYLAIKITMFGAFIYYTLVFDKKSKILSRHKTLNLCWLNVGPPLTTLEQRWVFIHCDVGIVAVIYSSQWIHNIIIYPVINGLDILLTNLLIFLWSMLHFSMQLGYCNLELPNYWTSRINYV